MASWRNALGARLGCETSRRVTMSPSGLLIVADNEQTGSYAQDASLSDSCCCWKARTRSRQPIPPGRSSRWDRQIQSRALHRDAFTTTRTSFGTCWLRSAPINTGPSPEIAYSGRATSLMFGRMTSKPELISIGTNRPLPMRAKADSSTA